ncbi:serine/threonine protein kinase, partial [Archangium sp.]|uniref:serine/threonine protein kinase n=1 Tax=Archangium sp. TaxID=1872627 RepID=UPI002D401B3D
LKAENLLIRREDDRPFLIDFGTVRLPGALTQTLGLPEGALHLLPPELIAYTRTGAWKRGEPFQGGVAADLYGLGVLLYQGLTDLHPFNPELPDEELVAAIATVPPEPPHLLNPLAPRSLSDITLKLLEKKPEARYPGTEALLQALETVAEQERKSPAWKVPLFTLEERATQPAPREVAAPPAQPPEAMREAPEEEQPPREEGPPPEGPPPEGPQPEGQQEAPPTPGRLHRARWPLLLLTCLSMLGLALWLARSTLAPPPEALLPGSGHSEKGSPPVSTPPTPSRFLTAWLCTVVGIGCPAAQVRPPGPADCPKEALEAMFRELKITEGSRLFAVVDINQPGDNELGFYQDGPVIGRIAYEELADQDLPAGTLLHGHLWTGPDVYDTTGHVPEPAIMGRYTLAVLPDGRKYPVCIVLGDVDGRIGRHPEGGGAAALNRRVPVSVVRRWP